MKKTLILPYFGSFPVTFPLWLESCKYNDDINWLIFSDISYENELPSNVSIIKMSFDELRDLFQKHFKFKISLETPYKLCDFKVTYGYVFSDYLADSDFWGYCDLDTVWGRIDHFLTDEVFASYDKIMSLGHLCFVRNKKEINEIFLKSEDYRLVFATPASYAFDEVGTWGGYHKGFNSLLIDSKYKIFSDYSSVADVDYWRSNFYVNSDKEPCVFAFKYGSLMKISKNSEKEVMYVHFQKRKMTLDIDEYSGSYLFIPNIIKEYSTFVSQSDFWENILLPETNQTMIKNLKKKKRKNDFTRFVYEPHKIKSLCGWVKCVIKNRYADFY